MTTKDYSYSVRNQDALAHMVGQLVEIGQTASLSDIARWFGFSKYKAQRLVNILRDAGIVYEVYVTHRSNASRKEFGLTSKGWYMYGVDKFKGGYKYFAAEKKYKHSVVS